MAVVYGTVVISSLSPGMTQSVNESDEGGRGFCTPCSLCMTDSMNEDRTELGRRGGKGAWSG